MSKQLFFLLTLVGFLAPPAWGQEGNLEDYVQQGLQSNRVLQSKTYDIQQSILQLKQAQTRFFPSISFDANYTIARGGRSIDFPIGDLLNPVYGTLNQMLAEDRFPTLENVSEQFLPNNFHETRLSLTQPLFNSDIYYAYKAQESLVEVEKAKRNAYENELVHEIRRAYFQHLKALEGQQIYLDARGVVEELQRVNERLVENGKATREVTAQAKAELARIDQELARADQLVQTSAAYFNFLINRDQDIQIEIDSAFFQGQDIPLQGRALENLSPEARPELEALRQGIAAQRTVVQLRRMDAVLPDLYLAAQAGFQGFGYTFDENQDFWLAQVGLSWNLFQGGARRNAKESATLQVTRLENDFALLRSQLELQIRNAWYGTRSAEEARKAAAFGEESAREAYRIVRRRYQEGQAIWLELVQANNQLTSAQLARSLAHFDLLIAQETLHQALSTR